jgi:bifunctional non-homologous end joining protein LigD
MQNSIQLHCQEGNSDKVYDIAIEEKLTGYVVNFAYGRRGSSLNVGTKTNEPVDIQDAQKIFNKLVKEKMAKGYVETGTTQKFVQAVARKATGVKGQLLNAIEEDEALRLLEDDDYIAQEKKDGVRATLIKCAKSITVGNKEGLSVGFPDDFNGLLKVTKDFTIDCESINNKLYVFDLLATNTGSIRNVTLLKRLDELKNLFEKDFKGIDCVSLVETAIGTEAKKLLYKNLLESNAEGIVFKRKSSPNVPGKPASGGDQLKRKFYETDFFIVEEVNNKRSVKISLINEEHVLVPAGNVTIPSNYDIPKKGAIIKVKYLYAFPESGVVFQPSYLGEQTNVDLSECTTEQLKYKPVAV